MLSIVTTTINEPTEATKRYAKLALNNDWTFYVVGDTKTPHKLYEDMAGVTYLHPDYQEKKYKELSDSIGWRSIQRRNIGFVEAYKESNNKVIATIDDDNIPYDDWGSDIKVNTKVNINHYRGNTYVFDPISPTSYHDKIWHRGFPLDYVPERKKAILLQDKEVEVKVQADFWNGDPDIDAMARLTVKPYCDFNSEKGLFPFTSENIHPFNSQNTFLSRDVIPHYAVWPHVGRMDDIWGGYYLQTKIKPNQVIFDKASVYQNRNEQDLITNLEKEIIGYRNTLSWVLNCCTINSDLIPDETKKFLDIYFNEFSK